MLEGSKLGRLQASSQRFGSAFCMYAPYTSKGGEGISKVDKVKVIQMLIDINKKTNDERPALPELWRYKRLDSKEAHLGV